MEEQEIKKKMNTQSNCQTKQNLNVKSDTARKDETQGVYFGGKASFQFKSSEVDESEESLRRPRSQTYMDAIQMMDMLSSTDEEIIERLKDVLDEDLLEEFKDKTPEEILEEIRLSIEEELATKKIPVENKLEGVLCKCYIEGCYVHSISPNGRIIDHYKKHGSIPPELEPGRRLYEKINGNCNCIEVYTHCCRIISTDGSVETVENENI